MSVYNFVSTFKSLKLAFWLDRELRTHPLRQVVETILSVLPGICLLWNLLASAQIRKMEAQILKTGMDC